MSAGHGYKFATARTTSPGGTAEPVGYLSNAAKTPNACTHAGWTDERVEGLKALWREGLSASQIARKLGGITRNAVIGKANRLGLEGRARPAAPQRIARVAPSRPRTISPKGVVILSPLKGGDVASANRLENIEARARPAENVLQMARAFAPLPDCEPVPFGSKGCKWPVDGVGADTWQCGCDCDGPYCAPHAAVAFQPLPKTKRSPAAELARSLRRYA